MRDVVKVTWKDRQFERQVLDPEIKKLMNRIGARGEAISKDLISGAVMPELRAVDQGFLMNSLSFIVGKVGRHHAVRVGTYKHPGGISLFYAIHVFLGTHKMPARPILRTMLAMIKVEMKRWI